MLTIFAFKIRSPLEPGEGSHAEKARHGSAGLRAGAGHTERESTARPPGAPMAPGGPPAKRALLRLPVSGPLWRLPVPAERSCHLFPFSVCHHALLSCASELGYFMRLVFVTLCFRSSEIVAGE